MLTPSKDDISSLSQSPRFNQSSSRNRETQRHLLKKHARSLEQTHNSNPKLRHSASLEKFPGNRSWLKPSLSLGNIQMHKPSRQGSLGGMVFSSTESLIEEPEPMEPNCDAFNQGKNQFRFISYQMTNSMRVCDIGYIIIFNLVMEINACQTLKMIF